MQTSKPLSQNAIGRALGLTSAMMVKLKKSGMPTDSVEAARTWRADNVRITANNMGRAEHQQQQAPAITREPAQPAKPVQASPDPSHQLEQLPPAAEPDAVTSYNEARRRRELAEANIAEMKQAELEGLLIRADAVRQAWAGKITTARDALLQIPSRLAPVLTMETDLIKTTQLLEDAVRQALAELSAERA
jgi:hypothetical protein